jgi:hypothetical protein
MSGLQGTDPPTKRQRADLPLLVRRGSSVRRRRPCVAATGLRNIAPPTMSASAWLLAHSPPTARSCRSAYWRTCLESV